MEFDWLDCYFDLKKMSPKEVEESFEDPFAIKLLPDGNYGAEEARYFCLGKSVRNRPIFSVFWTDGKNYRVIHAREMSENELSFYERRNASID
ncbi:MAG: BrnT family toxin [Verrucomicrobiota bacterium]